MLKKSTKLIKYFFQKRKIDMWSSVWQKKNINSKRYKRFTHKFTWYFLSFYPPLAWKKNNRKDVLANWSLDKSIYCSWVNYGKFFDQRKEYVNFKSYLYYHYEKKTELLQKSIFFKEKNFFKKHLLVNSLKKKKFFLTSLLNCNNALHKKKKIYSEFKDYYAIKKWFVYKRLPTIIWHWHNNVYYTPGRRKPQVYVRTLRKNFWWRNWLNQKFFITYYGFFCKRKFFFFKRKNNFKKMHSLERVLFLEKLLITSLMRLHLFSSFVQIKNLIKYGGVLINNKVVKNPFQYIPNLAKISFKKSLKKRILIRYAARLRNKQVLTNFPKCFVYSLPLLTFIRFRNPKKSEMKIPTGFGVKNPLLWI